MASSQRLPGTGDASETPYRYGSTPQWNVYVDSPCAGQQQQTHGNQQFGAGYQHTANTSSQLTHTGHPPPQQFQSGHSWPPAPAPYSPNSTLVPASDNPPPPPPPGSSFYPPPTPGPCNCPNCPPQQTQYPPQQHTMPNSSYTQYTDQMLGSAPGGFGQPSPSPHNPHAYPNASQPYSIPTHASLQVYAGENPQAPQFAQTYPTQCCCCCQHHNPPVYSQPTVHMGHAHGSLPVHHRPNQYTESAPPPPVSYLSQPGLSNSVKPRRDVRGPYPVNFVNDRPPHGSTAAGPPRMSLPSTSPSTNQYAAPPPPPASQPLNHGRYGDRPPPPMTPYFSSSNQRSSDRGHRGGRNEWKLSREQKRSSEFHCDVCMRSFNSSNAMRDHVEEEHVPCDEEGCSFSAPPSVLAVHKLKHVRDEDGIPIVDDPKEIAEWVEARRAKFPSKKNIASKMQTQQRRHEKGELTAAEAGQKGRPIGALERLLRNAMTTAHGRRAVLARTIERSALFPELNRAIRRQKFLNERLARSEKRRMQSRPPGEGDLKKHRGAGSHHVRLTEEFSICEHFLRFKKCKWGDQCHLSHDVAGYRRWQRQRNQCGLDIPMRPPLLYELLAPDVAHVESLVLQAFRYMVREHFWKDEKPEVEAVSDKYGQDEPLLSSTSLESGDRVLVVLDNDEEEDEEDEQEEEEDEEEEEEKEEGELCIEESEEAEGVLHRDVTC